MIGESMTGVVGEWLADEVGEKACCLLKRRKDMLAMLSNRVVVSFGKTTRDEGRFCD